MSPITHGILYCCVNCGKPWGTAPFASLLNMCPNCGTDNRPRPEEPPPMVRTAHGETTCSCGARFVQRLHERTGNPAPITIYHDPRGNIRVNPDGTYGIIRKGDLHIGSRFLNHFAECPDREKYGGR